MTNSELARRLCPLGEVARRLGISIYSSRRHADPDTGTLKSVRIGGRVLVPAEEIEKAIENGLPTPRLGRPKKKAPDAGEVAGKKHKSAISI